MLLQTKIWNTGKQEWDKENENRKKTLGHIHIQAADETKVTVKEQLFIIISYYLFVEAKCIRNQSQILTVEL